MCLQALSLIGLIIWISLCTFQQAPYPKWAHSHIVWLNAGIQNQADLQTMIQVYLDYGIRVGGLNIDAAWQTTFNDFNFNPKLFPQPLELIEFCHHRGIKVLVWTSSIVNENCPLFKEGIEKGYFLNKGKTIKWWLGKGAFVDFTNPQAKKWWQLQMEKVLSIGIDGFKTDGTDPLMIELGLAKNYKGRPIGFHEYSHSYYGSVYNYTRQRNSDGLIMSRPVDSLANLFYLTFSPKYVMFAGWVGDQDSSPSGFKVAMSNILMSAWKGYLNFGFDIGGYRGQNISKSIFLRWTQVGALLPYMENGGNGHHRPWLFDAQTVLIYRQFVDLHYEFGSFFLTKGTECFQKGISVLWPVANPAFSRTNIFMPLDSYGYVLGDTFLVFPVFSETGIAHLKFPYAKGRSKKSLKWYYYFNKTKIFTSGEDLELAFPLRETPLFIKEGSVYPTESKIFLVNYQQKGCNNYTFLYGDYSDLFTICLSNSVLQGKVLRSYRNGTQSYVSIPISVTREDGNDYQIYASVQIPNEDSEGIGNKNGKLEIKNQKSSFEIDDEKNKIRNEG